MRIRMPRARRNYYKEQSSKFRQNANEQQASSFGRIIRSSWGTFIKVVLFMFFIYGIAFGSMFVLNKNFRQEVVKYISENGFKESLVSVGVITENGVTSPQFDEYFNVAADSKDVEEVVLSKNKTSKVLNVQANKQLKKSQPPMKENTKAKHNVKKVAKRVNQGEKSNSNSISKKKVRALESNRELCYQKDNGVACLNYAKECLDGLDGKCDHDRVLKIYIKSCDLREALGCVYAGEILERYRNEYENVVDVMKSLYIRGCNLGNKKACQKSDKLQYH